MGVRVGTTLMRPWRRGLALMVVAAVCHEVGAQVFTLDRAPGALLHAVGLVCFVAFGPAFVAGVVLLIVDWRAHVRDRDAAGTPGPSPND
jgi:hypothetical protein